MPGLRMPHDLTDSGSLHALIYEHVVTLTRRVEDLRQRLPGVRILMLKEDVQGAYRHLRHHADDCGRLCGISPDGTTAIVDLSAPFGWRGSPALYGVFGGAICHLVVLESPASMSRARDDDTTPFFAHAWVDDHVMIEVDVGLRCATAEDALRLAILAVFGPRVINESKFTGWSSRISALGLEWDTVAGTLSIPSDKIEKAYARVADACKGTHIRRHTLEQLLGSLRHSFYQRLHALGRFAPRHGCVVISDWARDGRLRACLHGSLEYFQIPTYTTTWMPAIPAAVSWIPLRSYSSSSNLQLQSGA